jgi:hypothetical protein
VATRRWDAAPNPEWALMYRRGLTRRQIVELTGDADRTVAYHLAAARSEDPGLEDEQAAAARPNAAGVTSRGLEYTHELIAMVHTSGSYPSSNSPSFPKHRKLI